jgi:hypothetical protein
LKGAVLRTQRRSTIAKLSHAIFIRLASIAISKQDLSSIAAG